MANPVKTAMSPTVWMVMYAGFWMERMKMCKMKLSVSTTMPMETTSIDLERL